MYYINLIPYLTVSATTVVDRIVIRHYFICSGLHHQHRCDETFFFNCSAHLFPISLNFRRSFKVQGCDKGEHCNMCAVFSAAGSHAHVISRLT